jgi:hypothetical protein
MAASEIMRGGAMGRTNANCVIAGTQVPHLAALVGVELPGTFAAALFTPEGVDLRTLDVMAEW